MIFFAYLLEIITIMYYNGYVLKVLSRAAVNIPISFVKEGKKMKTIFEGGII